MSQIKLSDRIKNTKGHQREEYPFPIWVRMAIELEAEVERLRKKEREYEEFKAVVFAKAQRFVNKVETGRAKSKETYSDMKELMTIIQLLNKEK